MARFHLNVSPSYSRISPYAGYPVASVVKPETKFSFRRILLVGIVAGFACGLAYGAAEAAPLGNDRFELRVELNGNVYAADYGLTGDDCLNAADNISEVETADGVFVDVPKDAPVYCVSM